MKLFDTHSHIYEDRFDEDRDAMIAALSQNNIELCMCVGADLETSRLSYELAEKHPNIYSSAGFHPSSVSKFSAGSYREIKSLLIKDKVVAVGEIGLDYYYDTNPRDLQMDIFTQQLQTARELNMPSIMHIRDAWGDFLPMLKGWNQEAVVHCWTGSLESAKICLDAGLHISFTGSVTFKNANKLRAVAKYIPLDRLMIETDAPYMAPVPKRGKRNEPKYVLHVAEMFAELKGISLETIANKTFENGKRFFNINGV